MPLYDYACPCGHSEDAYRSVDGRDDGPAHCGVKMQRVITPPRLNCDIRPYMTVAADKETGKTVWIDSRAKHRAFLSRNGYEEVGSESTLPKNVQEKHRELAEAARDPSRKFDNSVEVSPN